MLDFQCEGKICESCQEVIADRYFLHVNGGCWHADCLRCCVCYSSLEQEDSCFVKEDNIYCKQDYIRYLSLSLSRTNNETFTVGYIYQHKVLKFCGTYKSL